MGARQVIEKAVPILEMHRGIMVVRDDLFPGGTKARFIPALFKHVDELVYASPACGGAQFALATVARQMGTRATIVVAKRKEMHARTLQAKALGAQILEVSPGYLTVVQARAREYAERVGVRLLPFGLDVPDAQTIIAEAAEQLNVYPDEVWCAGGSGVLARALALAWPHARFHIVQVGHELQVSDLVENATIHAYPAKFEKAIPSPTEFSSDGNYDAKAWSLCKANHGEGKVLFWNVAPKV